MSLIRADRCSLQRPLKLTVAVATGIQRETPVLSGLASKRHRQKRWIQLDSRGSSRRLDSSLEFSSISALSTAKHQLINAAAGDGWRGRRVIMHIKPA